MAKSNIAHMFHSGKPTGPPFSNPVFRFAQKRHAWLPRENQMTPVKLYRIGEVMRYSGLSRQTVHNYTILGLIKEADRTDGGHRLYCEDVFETIRRIEESQENKYP